MYHSAGACLSGIVIGGLRHLASNDSLLGMADFAVQTKAIIFMTVADLVVLSALQVCKNIIAFLDRHCIVELSRTKKRRLFYYSSPGTFHILLPRPRSI
jgi:hypothetical protein